MSALAGVLSCDASNVTGIVDRLEGRGLVERRGAEGDRRVKALATTRAGAALRRRLLERIARPPSVFDALPDSDRKELARILGRTLENGT
jgi:DNA-binding MarR family transcriptional regulator